MKTRVAVVGTGAVGRGIVQVVQRSNNMEIVAVANRNPATIENVKPYLPSGAFTTTVPL